MTGFLTHIDTQLFLFLNGLNNPFFDAVMTLATNAVWWIPLFLVLLWVTIREYRWQIVQILLGLALLIAVSDQFANLSKHGFKRLRPSHETALEGKVHVVDGRKGGMYGFYSGHASSTFAVACYVSLLFRRKKKWVAPVMFAWALVMCYTRIYLGLHYPFDILAGMVAGSSLGLLFGWLVMRVIPCRICS